MVRCFFNLRTSAKLRLGFGVCLALAIALAVVGLTQISRLNSVTSEMNRRMVKGLSALSDITDASRRVRTGHYRMAVALDNQSEREMEKFVAQADQDLKSAFASYSKTLESENQKQGFEGVQKAWAEYAGFEPALIDLCRQEDLTRSVRMLEGEMKGPFQRFDEALDELQKRSVDDAAALNQTAYRVHASAQGTMITLLGICLATGLLCATVIGRYISTSVETVDKQLEALADGPIAELALGLEKLNSGDLTRTIQVQTQELEVKTCDDFGSMFTACNRIRERVLNSIEQYDNAQDSLSTLVQKIRQASTNVRHAGEELASATNQSSSASQEIAAGSEKLAQNASSAAATVDSVLRAVSQVSDSSAEQYDTITQADQKSKESVALSQTVSEGSQQVSQAAESGSDKMRSIAVANEQINAQVHVSEDRVRQLDESSRRIGAIVATIEGIAEQTNLLALNAAIEAARAGEHGRGFAVVADEVRKLAEQAGASTKEIVSLINGVTKNVEETVEAIAGTRPLVEKGTQLSREASESLDLIFQIAKNASTETSKVAFLGGEVSKLLEAVRNSAQANRDLSAQALRDTNSVASEVTNVAAVSEETAASSQELNATAEEVSAAAQQLNAMSAELARMVEVFKVNESSSLRLAA